MRLAVISDLHCPHWNAWSWGSVVGDIKRSLDEEQPDLVIDAGDAETDVSALLGCEVFQVKGNHDWYGRDFAPSEIYTSGHKRDTLAWWDGVTLVVGCTLWTDYNGGDPAVMAAVDRSLADRRAIANFSAKAALAEHAADRAWLEEYVADESGPQVDVVVTHHAPSWRSVHPRYEGAGLVNCGFVSRLDHLVEAISPRLWVHGHVHDPFDYTIGQTRVVAWPLGYPNERAGKPPYKPLYIDL